MATVRISKAFLEEVKDHIDRMRNAELKSMNLESIDAEFSNGNQPSKLAEHTKWGEHYPLRAQMPKEWMVEPHSVDFRVYYKSVYYKNESGEYDRRFANIHCTDVKGTMLPPGVSGYRPDIDLKDEQVMNEASYALYPEMREIRRIFDITMKRMRVMEKWENTGTQIREFFEAQPSLNAALNAALKVYPALELYTPKKYLAEVAREVERKARRSTATLDEAALAAQAVEVRLRQSLGGAL